jgi:hypothetical protein
MRRIRGYSTTGNMNQKRRLITAVFCINEFLFRRDDLDIGEELVDCPGDPAVQSGW